MLNSVTEATDLEYMREWDNFGDTLDNLDYDLGSDGVQYKLHGV